MFVKVGFFLYLFVLLLYSVYTGINYYKIQAKGWIHPQVITFLVPFIINVTPFPRSSSQLNSSSIRSTRYLPPSLPVS